MNKVDIPGSLSVNAWTGEKNTMGKDKAVAGKLTTETTKLTEAVKALDSAHSKIEAVELKGISTLAAADAAMAKLDKADVKGVVAAAKAAVAAATAFSNASDKMQKGLPAPSQKVAAAAKAAALLMSKEATKFSTDIGAAAEAARSELQGIIDKLKAGEKKNAPAPVKASPKALADAKNLSALMRKSIALLRTPKGSPMPVRFLVLFNKANPKELKLYLGPKPESGLAKLKTQFAADVKVNRVRDAKGHVVWEKGALTFLSDILKPGLAKQIQIAIRLQTKVTVKVRIKRSDGAVDEADAKDVSDDELKVSPAEEAAMLAAGKAYEAALKELDGAIQAALKGPGAAKVKSLLDAIKAAGKAEKFDLASDGIDELQSLLEESEVGDSDGKDLEADSAEAGPGDKSVGPAKALGAKLAALRSKFDKAMTAGSEAAKAVNKYADLAEKLLSGEIKGGIDKATQAVNQVEKMLGEAIKAKTPTIPVAKLEAARNDWIKSRDKAIKEITTLSKAIVAAFASDAEQKKAVKDAITKLGELQIALQTGLDNELNLTIKAKDPEKQADLADRARDSLASLTEFVEKDDLLMNLDNNEIISSMSVVGPMKKSLKAVEAALGR